ncbi:MAG: hypothetical protein IKA87_07865 [Lentisphaeria bacterium]|nr:hypothetical protein [Lentisphaeria bacterium]
MKILKFLSVIFSAFFFMSLFAAAKPQSSGTKSVNNATIPMQKFLKKIHAPDYWRYAKDFPAIYKDSKYKSYPQLIRTSILYWGKQYAEFEAGKTGILPVLQWEVLIIKRMMLAKDLPAAMHKQLVTESYNRLKKICELSQQEFSAGKIDRDDLDIAQKNLKLFMKQNNIKK